MHGFGRQVKPNGDQVVGFWKNGKKHGNFYEITFEKIMDKKTTNYDWTRVWYD